MKTLDGYKKALVDLEEATTIYNTISSHILEMDSEIKVSSSVAITGISTDNQYVYALGILNSQIAACKELGIDSTGREEMKLKIFTFRNLMNEMEEWSQFKYDLLQYANDVKKLLTDKERFSLLKYPVKG
jgi:hypothetical protein